jgi:hypothetical protein
MEAVALKKRYMLGIISVFLAIFILQSCAYVHIQRPLGVNYHNTSLGTKIGRSSSYSLMWLVAWGDAGAKAAAENGGITVIKHSDIEVTSVLFGFYTCVTTILYGD